MSERLDTKSKILDAAEKLFGIKGFEATSLRDITAEAQVNLAAVNYHFQSKDSLIDAVIERRIAPVNRMRLEMLLAAGPSPTLEQIMEAFVSPLVNQSLPPAQLVGRFLGNPKQFAERVFRTHLSDIAQKFVEAVQKTAPELSVEEIYWRLHFAGGAMAHVLRCAEVMPALSNGQCDPSDHKAVADRLVAFLANGFRAPVASKASVKTLKAPAI